MAGKAPVFCGRALYYTLDEVTKNQWIDFAVDLARAELGEGAGDTEVTAWLQSRLNTVWLHRKDKQIDLASRYERCLRASANYVKAHTKPE